jgi:hypothetical protein
MSSEQQEQFRPESTSDESKLADWLAQNKPKTAKQGESGIENRFVFNDNLKAKKVMIGWHFPKYRKKK